MCAAEGPTYSNFVSINDEIIDGYVQIRVSITSIPGNGEIARRIPFQWG
jgi:hypothetical protein